MVQIQATIVSLNMIKTNINCVQTKIQWKGTYILKLTLRNRENRESHCGMAASLRLNEGISDCNNTPVKTEKKGYARLQEF